MRRMIGAALAIILCAAAFGALAEADPLSARLDVLRGLDIEISEPAEALVRQSLRDLEARMRPGTADITDYAFILMYLGAGDYDRKTYDILPVTDGVYDFDAEMVTIEDGYWELLDAVQRMSRGEIVISNYDVWIREELWQTGWGEFPLDFTMNGRVCHFDARLRTDWMDVRILDFLNEQLEALDAKGRLWFMADEGQGMVVFYRDAEWVARFEAATGLRLTMNVGETVW